MTYTKTSEIQREIIHLIEKKSFTPRLIEIIDLMSEGIYLKYAQNKDLILWDDYHQNCWIKFMRVYPKADLDKNLFAWFSTVFINELRAMYRNVGVLHEHVDFSFDVDKLISVSF